MRIRRTNFVAAGLAIGCGLWAVPRLEVPARPQPAIRGIDATLPMPPDVVTILTRSCADCHSNQTRWPWYSQLPPASWMVSKDVNGGRKAMNLSELSVRGGKNPTLAATMLLAACADVQSGRMPLPGYRLLHPGSRLTSAEVSAVCRWTAAASGRIFEGERLRKRTPKTSFQSGIRDNNSRRKEQMNRNRKILFIPAALLLIASAQTAPAISSGAPEGSSGAPKEGYCTACHGGTANSGPGRLRIEFAGSDVYSPGERVRMRVVIEDPVAKRWGFQLTARPESSPDAGAGQLETASSETQVISSGSLQWITHTAGGTRRAAAPPVTYEFDWTAPDSAAGPVVFYAAANAANGNGSSSGDSIHTSTLRLSAAAPVQRPAFTSNSVTEISTGQTAIAPGAWVSIAGADLAGQLAYGSPVQGKQLETTVGKVTVKVNGVAAPLSYVSPARLTFLVPAATPEGDVPIVVENDGRVSDTITVRSARALPAALTTPEPNSDPQRFFATATTVGAVTALSLISAKGVFLGKPETDPTRPPAARRQ